MYLVYCFHGYSAVLSVLAFLMLVGTLVDAGCRTYKNVKVPEIGQLGGNVHVNFDPAVGLVTNDHLDLHSEILAAESAATFSGSQESDDPYSSNVSASQKSGKNKFSQVYASM